jgi:hypothetical protein
MSTPARAPKSRFDAPGVDTRSGRPGASAQRLPVAPSNTTGTRLRAVVSYLLDGVVPNFSTAPDERLTLGPDHIPWTVDPAPDRVVAIGDLHGDLVALASILHAQGLADDEGHWTGGPVHLVLNGDLVGGHPDSRLLMEFVIRLEQEAAACGGAVHSLLGNHDVVCLSDPDRPLRRGSAKLMEKFPVPGAPGRDCRGALRGYTRYANWLRARNAILRLGDTLFVHAGINGGMLYHHPARVNATVRAWIRYWQGIAPKPDDRTGWSVGQPRTSADRNGAATGKKGPFRRTKAGPLWSRAFKPSTKRKGTSRRHAGAPDAESLQAALERYAARRLVIGHIPVKGKQIQLSHPDYGAMVVMIDTRISVRKSGALTCLELRGGGLKARSFKRSAAGRRIRHREMQRLKAQALAVRNR